MKFKKFMLEINLLPSAQIETASLEKNRRTVKFFAVFLSAIFLVGSILLLPSYFPLFLVERQLERSLTLEEEAGKEFNAADILNKSRDAHDRINSVKDFAGRPPRASQILEYFLENAGNGISLNTLNVNSGGSISIGGLADTRDDLINYQNRLQSSGKLQNISFPVSNIIQENNVNFTADGKLNPDAALLK